MFEDKMTKKINENVLLKYGARHFAYTLKNCFARKRTYKIETGKNLGRVYKWCSSFFCVAWEAFKIKEQKYIGLLPILGGGEYPLTNIFPFFS